MPRFDDHFMTELKARTDIVDLISQHVTLKRAGSRLVGLCPFHSEKTGSFTVFTDSASYYCFGCGAGGDVVTFTMNMEHLDYPDAVTLLAQRAHLPLPEDGREGDTAMKKRSRQLEMNKLAARRFFTNLKDPNTPQGMQYFLGRGLTKDTIIRFGLGYAADSFTDLRDHLKAAGFSYEEAFEAGLLIKSQKNGKYYDKFRNRVMFPVIDVRGNVVAFSGRVLDDSKPKYMNSPETLVYKKSQTVFGLNFAKQNAQNRIILVEGNLDVASLHQAGFDGAVAPLGTAFTKEQARMISKYASTVVVAFDMDKAGLKATDKAIDYLEELGVSVRVLQMQGAKDPDEFIKKYGKVQFERLISGSKNPVQHTLDKLAGERDLSDVSQRAEYMRKAVSVVAKVPSDIERDIFAGVLARQIEVSVDSVRTEIKRARERYVTQVKNQQMADASPTFSPVDRVNPQRSANLRAAKAEEGIIALLNRLPDRARWLEERLTPEDFITDFNRSVYRFFMEKIAEGVSPETLISAHFEAPEVARIVQILNTQVYGKDPMQQFADYIDVLKQEGRKRKAVDQQSPEQLKQMLEQKKRSN